MRMTIIPNRKSTTVGPQVDLPFDQLMRDYFEESVPLAEKTDAAAFCPATFVDPHGARTNANVDSIHALVLDIDGITPEEMADLRHKLKRVCHFMHPSFSWNRSAGKEAWRVVLPFETPVPGHQWKEVWQDYITTYFPYNDPVTSDPCRLFFLPSHPQTGRPEDFPEPSSNYTAPTIDAFDLRAALSDNARWATVLSGNKLPKAERHNIGMALTMELAKEYPLAREAQVAKLFTPSFVATYGPDDWQDRIEQHVLEPWRSARAKVQFETGRVPITEIARAMGVPANKIASRMIYRNGKFMYTYDAQLGRYQPMVTDRMNLHDFKTYLGTVDGVEFNKVTAKGAVMPKTAVEVLSDYSTNFNELAYRLGAKCPEFDEPSRTLVLPTAPLRGDLTPSREPVVEEWIEALAGKEHAEELTEWLARAPDLGLQSLLLVLTGPPASGKTAFARQVSRLWGSSHTPGARAMERFNFELRNSPLVLFDEGKPMGIHPREFLQWIREAAIEASTHIEQKHGLRARLEGYLRIIITSNYDTVFSSDHIDVNSAEGLARRVLSIEVPNESKGWLSARAQNPIPDDAVARHALWLNRERRPKLPQVGNGAKMARIIQHRSVTVDAIMRGVCLYLEGRVPMSLKEGHCPDLHIQGGEVYTRATFFLDNWDRLGLTELVGQRVTAAALGRALAGLSGGVLPIRTADGPRNMHRIPRQDIEAHLEANDYDEKKVLEALKSS